MAHYDLEEQEQIDSIKTWWKMYGNLVSGVIFAASLAVVGWQGWNWYLNNQAAKAAAIYGVLQQAVAAGDSQRIRTTAGELAEKYGRTGYAHLAALVAAKHSFDSSDLKTAAAQLAWTVENGKDELRDIARLRLAAVQLDEKSYDDALKQLDAAHAPAFDAHFQEMRGDILFAQGKTSEARTAYQAALTKIGEAASAGRQLLQQKLDSLGEAA